MKFFHISDLHIGKRVHGFSILEDQEYILNRIISEAALKAPDAMVIAGDIYDKAVPTAEAVSLFDNFLYKISTIIPHVFIISGNHDSPQRLSFASRLIDKSGIHISKIYDGNVQRITLNDEFGDVDFYMMPFIKPSSVRAVFPDRAIKTYTDAMKMAIKKLPTAECNRKIIIAHQFITGSERSESEEITIGGLDNVDASVFEGFDYVALGHIHAPQSLNERIRYCGTPLKYSFSETHQTKSITVVTIASSGEAPKIDLIALTPLRDMVELKGTYDELMLKSNYEKLNTDDYFHITLTDDEEDIFDAQKKLRLIYPNLMRLDYDNSRTGANADNVFLDTQTSESLSPIDIFEDLYYMQNAKDMSDEQLQYVSKIIEGIEEGSI